MSVIYQARPWGSYELEAYRVIDIHPNGIDYCVRIMNYKLRGSSLDVTKYVVVFKCLPHHGLP